MIVVGPFPRAAMRLAFSETTRQFLALFRVRLKLSSRKGRESIADGPSHCSSI